MKKVTMKVVAVIGTGKKSGKTVTVEALIKELNARKYKVGAIKQIHEEDFSIDTPHKDTWRIAEAGAKIVVSAAPREVAVIKRLKNEEKFLASMQLLENEDLDVVIVEGNPPGDVPKIFIARNPEGARKILPRVKGVLCIASLSPEKFKFNLPVFHPLRDIKKIADIIEKHLLR
ncbi:MAG: molybdopterin-guanine dinucleotide biosynthesis protein B [Candidatus Hydrothermarchaeota archaeon]|nr:molybdopterin-guanine dinucleotide biosynthesis protein B [Candidatus Hydrothermarchaeota archaeon]